MDFEYRPQLPTIGAPTLAIIGARNLICAPRVAAVIRAGIPGSRLVTRGRSKHLVHLEEPRKFADFVSAFVAALTGTCVIRAPSTGVAI